MMFTKKELKALANGLSPEWLSPSRDYEEVITALANYILDDMGYGWLPYPENVPEETGVYEITRKKDWFSPDYEPETWTDVAVWDNDVQDWFEYDGDKTITVLAFRPLPAPYQPE